MVHSNFVSVFETCSIKVSDQLRRGAKITCGRCQAVEQIAVNTMRRSGDDDDEKYDKLIAHKFEKTGWKVGKAPAQHRCPNCFTALKIAAVRKSNEMKHPPENKVVPITPAEQPRPVVRTMTRDERRIIFEKINEVYVGEAVGYSDDWSDEKVSTDLGVPRAWVSALREEYFGPDVNEKLSKATQEAKAFLVELSALQDNITLQVNTLFAKAQEIRKVLSKLLEK